MFGKYNTWIAYSLWNSLTCPFFLICGTNITMAYIVAAINGSAVGGQFIIESMVNDVITYGNHPFN